MPRDGAGGTDTGTDVCSDCQQTFMFDAGFYAERRLRPPSRCRRCRGERTARLTPMRGTVSKVTDDIVVIEAMVEKFIAFGTAGLRVGDPVTFGTDATAPRRPGQLRVARSVRRLP